MSREIETLLDAARAARSEGRVAEACEAYTRAAVMARQAGEPMLEGHALRHASDLDLEAGRNSRALAAAERAARLYQGAGRSLDLANALRLKGRALQAVNRSADAREAWSRARDLYAQTGVAAGVAECDSWLAG
jgi:tetratricopeptide (TPR) repeat protein